MIFTPEKEFFKLLFGVKITPPKNNSTVRSKINPSRGVIITPWKLLCNWLIFSKWTFFTFSFWTCQPTPFTNSTFCDVIASPRFFTKISSRQVIQQVGGESNGYGFLLVLFFFYFPWELAGGNPRPAHLKDSPVLPSIKHITNAWVGVVKNKDFWIGLPLYLRHLMFWPATEKR